MTGARTTRRQVVAGTVAALATGSLPTAATANGALPNILWIVSEDNCPFIGAYGDPLSHTPAIDRLASQGILYRNVYSKIGIAHVLTPVTS